MPMRADVIEAWIALFNTGNLEDADAIATAGYLEHAVAPFGLTEPGLVNGPEHLRSTARWLRAQFPDLAMSIEALVTEGDLICARIASSGTNLGPIGGILPPTGRSFSASQSHWFRVRDGRLSEHWATRDDLTAMIQLGVIAPPGHHGVSDVRDV